MATIQRFEDLEVWQKARKLCNLIHPLTLIAKGSCAEVRSQLYRAIDRKHVSNDEFNSAFTLAEEISKNPSGFISYLNNSDIKGIKYKSEI